MVAVDASFKAVAAKVSVKSLEGRIRITMQLKNCVPVTDYGRTV